MKAYFTSNISYLISTNQWNPTIFRIVKYPYKVHIRKKAVYRKHVVVTIQKIPADIILIRNAHCYLIESTLSALGVRPSHVKTWNFHTSFYSKLSDFCNRKISHSLIITNYQLILGDQLLTYSIWRVGTKILWVESENIHFQVLYKITNFTKKTVFCLSIRLPVTGLLENGWICYFQLWWSIKLLLQKEC